METIQYWTEKGELNSHEIDTYLYMQNICIRMGNIHKYTQTGK